MRRGLIRRWSRDANGNVAVLFALALPAVTGAAAFGVETGYWYYDQYRLQKCADAAAYAAGLENRAGASVGTMTAAATAAAASNGFIPGVDSLVLNNPPSSGPNQNDGAVEVALLRPGLRFFSQVFTSAPVNLRARAVAASLTDGDACILALDKGAHRAVEFTGSSTVELIGCSVMSNSVATDSLYAQGSTSVEAPCLMTSGGASLNNGVHMTECAAPLTLVPPVADPYRALPEPSVTGSCLSSGGSTLAPGRYCGGLNLNGNKTLAPGVYIIDGGTLRTNGNANIVGSGVTFFLTGNANLSFNGNAELRLSAPTSGAYTGVLFFGARANSASASISMNGASDSIMTGAIYFPAQPVAYLGDMSGANGCTQIVARTVTWSGHSSFSADCSAYGMSNVRVGGFVRLAE